MLPDHALNCGLVSVITKDCQDSSCSMVGREYDISSEILFLSWDFPLYLWVVLSGPLLTSVWEKRVYECGVVKEE